MVGCLRVRRLVTHVAYRKTEFEHRYQCLVLQQVLVLLPCLHVQCVLYWNLRSQKVLCLSLEVAASYIPACTGQACLKVAEAFGRCTDLSGPDASVGEGNLGSRCSAVV